MIPKFVSIGSVWPVLPPGLYNATLREIEDRFCTNSHRKYLFEGFKKGVASLLCAGCNTIFLDGSFVSGKPYPRDFDVCWDPTGVDDKKLDPVLLDFSQNRRRQKQELNGEFFPASVLADGHRTFVDFFQRDRHTGKAKGIIKVHFT